MNRIFQYGTMPKNQRYALFTTNRDERKQLEYDLRICPIVTSAQVIEANVLITSDYVHDVARYLIQRGWKRDDQELIRLRTIPKLYKIKN